MSAENVETKTMTMRFAGFDSLAELLYSQLLPGSVALFDVLFFISLFKKDLFTLITHSETFSNLNDFLVAILGFLAAIILGNIVDGIRHRLFDKCQRRYGQYWCLWRFKLSKDDISDFERDNIDPVCVLVGKESSAMEKQELRQWLRVNIYYPGELMGNLALTFPVLFVVVMLYLILYLSFPIYGAVLIIILGLWLSWFMFKVSSRYIAKYELDISTITSNKGQE